MITRAQARHIAERFLAERGPIAGWEGVDHVLSPEEFRNGLSPISRPTFDEGRLGDCWSLQVGGTAGAVIWISRQTGKVEMAAAVSGSSSHSG